MAEPETIARPYAEAIFSMAKAEDALAGWSDAVNAIAAVVQNADGAELINDPLVDAGTRAETIIAVAIDDLGPESSNLVRLLAEKSRLELAPEIASAYDALCTADQNTLDVDVTTAIDLNDEQTSRLKTALENRLNKTVRLHVSEDKNVLGGAIIKAGDLVFDHTISGQLERLHQKMAHSNHVR